MSYSSDQLATFGEWMGGPPTTIPGYNGRVRQQKMAKLREAVERLVSRELGAEPRVQILIVDLITHRPLLYLPDPIRVGTIGEAPTNPQHKARVTLARFSVASHNAAVAMNEVRHATELMEVAGFEMIRHLPDGQSGSLFAGGTKVCDRDWQASRRKGGAKERKDADE